MKNANKKNPTSGKVEDWRHYFDKQVRDQGVNPAPTTLIRLAQEIADLSNSLPCDPTNAMYCRVEKERVDLMKVMIMGAQGTPYAHGAFVFHLFFPNSYPQ
jgi:ubiquitin-protein ligase